MLPFQYLNSSRGECNSSKQLGDQHPEFILSITWIQGWGSQAPFTRMICTWCPWDIYGGFFLGDASHLRCEVPRPLSSTPSVVKYPVRCQISSYNKYNTFIARSMILMVKPVRLRSPELLHRHISLGEDVLMKCPNAIASACFASQQPVVWWNGKG